MVDTKHIRIEDYDYALPDERIAKYPVSVRDQSKLLIYNKGEISEDTFLSLPHYLPQGALMVFNNTKVIQARLHFHKESGALIEIFCLEPFSPHDYQLMFQQTESCEWVCLVGNSKKWKEGLLRRILVIRNREVILTATRMNQQVGAGQIIKFAWDDSNISFAEILEAVGELPIPPYLNRATEESDKETYQTVYSKVKGSVAAPTAGLHFTERVLRALDESGVERDEITLHVGAGTFKPVKTEEISEHEMHSEYIYVSRKSIEKLIKHGGRCIAVGTTSVRTLESLYYIGVKISRNPNLSETDLHVEQWLPYEYEEGKGTLTTLEALQQILDYMARHELDAIHTSTQIIIAPGYKYHIVEMMVTNFHQPRSTLLLLVSAFVKGDWRKIYDYALGHDFRFLSYGDSSLLIP